MQGCYNGSLVHLSGLDVVGATVGAISRLIQDREVELWENERWVRGSASVSDDSTAVDGTWSKSNLKPGERLAWTRGRDGWSGVADDGSGEVR